MKLLKETEVKIAFAEAKDHPLSADVDYQQFDRKKGLLHFTYPVGLGAAVFMYKFHDWDTANCLRKEVLPGFSASGMALFPVASSLTSPRNPRNRYAILR